MAGLKVVTTYTIDLRLEELISFLKSSMHHLKCIISEELLDNIGFSYHSHFGSNSLDLSKVNHAYRMTPIFLECTRNLESLLSLNQFNNDAVNIIFNYISCCLDQFLTHFNLEYCQTILCLDPKYSQIILNVHFF